MNTGEIVAELNRARERAAHEERRRLQLERSPEDKQATNMEGPVMAKYRKKPVVIEAMQLTGGTAQWHEVYQWIEHNTLGSFEPLDVIEGRKPYPASGVSIDPRDGRFIISTLEGLHWADPEDWIIRGVQGEFYPCKSDIFEATYERVADDERTDPVSEVRGDEAP